MRLLRSNTPVIVSVGPFCSKVDGVTLQTSLTITNEKITIIAETDDGAAPIALLNNVSAVTTGSANDLNYISGGTSGIMQLELSAANTANLGRLFLSITDANNHVPVFHEYMVVPAAIYDSMYKGVMNGISYWS